ncbi:hypothetical protein [Alkaliphilus sp. B6464]|uniref:hypothetical protein n=1 Tax=Alkaliphilus sp. B6464 TaxID=2731219 RepID=UPI001BA4D949|nr:hypothetical protein [Alkaliphilus sp. B6464]QUH20367.1 hypothetical protein HYG84_10970 [Alkaliphilus sp. B6464]
MKYIPGKDINLGLIFTVLFGITIVGGFVKWPLFILAGIFLLSYIVLDRNRLKCPNCGNNYSIFRYYL